MKKVLGMAVVLVFALVATSYAQQAAQPAKDTASKITVKAVEKTPEGTTTVKVKETGEKVAAKVSEPGATVKVKVDYKAECLAKFKGKNETDKEVVDCIAKAKIEGEKLVEKLVEPAKAQVKEAATTTAAKPLATEKKTETPAAKPEAQKK